MAAKPPGGGPGTLSQQQFYRSPAGRKGKASYEGYLKYITAARKKNPYVAPTGLEPRQVPTLDTIIKQIKAYYPHVYSQASLNAQALKTVRAQTVPLIAEMGRERRASTADLMRERRLSTAEIAAERRRGVADVSAENKALVDQLNKQYQSRAQGTASLVQSGVEGYAKAIAGLPGQVQAQTAAGEAQTAGANEALTSFLQGQGLQKQQQLSAALQQVNAPQSQGMLDAASAGVGQGTAGALLGAGTASLDRMAEVGGSQGAFAATLPGLVRLRGMQDLGTMERQLNTDWTNQLGDLQTSLLSQRRGLNTDYANQVSRANVDWRNQLSQTQRDYASQTGQLRAKMPGAISDLQTSLRTQQQNDLGGLLKTGADIWSGLSQNEINKAIAAQGLGTKLQTAQIQAGTARATATIRAKAAVRTKIIEKGIAKYKADTAATAAARKGAIDKWKTKYNDHTKTIIAHMREAGASAIEQSRARTSRANSRDKVLIAAKNRDAAKFKIQSGAVRSAVKDASNHAERMHAGTIGGATGKQSPAQALLNPRGVAGKPVPKSKAKAAIRARLRVQLPFVSKKTLDFLTDQVLTAGGY